jgi:hypothetical protein
MKRITKMRQDAWEMTADNLIQDHAATKRYVMAQLISQSKSAQSDAVKVKALELMGKAVGSSQTAQTSTQRPHHQSNSRGNWLGISSYWIESKLEESDDARGGIACKRTFSDTHHSRGESMRRHGPLGFWGCSSFSYVLLGLAGERAADEGVHRSDAAHKIKCFYTLQLFGHFNFGRRKGKVAGVASLRSN